MEHHHTEDHTTDHPPPSEKNAPIPSSPPSLAHQYGGHHSGTWVACLPASWTPYIQLARLSPPAALFLIFFPHAFGLLLAAIHQHHSPPLLLRPAAALLAGSLFFSNAAHAWNDVVDAPIDGAVARTRARPIPRGALSIRQALWFAGAQAAAAAAVLVLTLPGGCVGVALPNVAATAYYPLAKRHTHFAQLVLGGCLAWGVGVGYAAAGGGSRGGEGPPALLCLFLACVLWTVIYDSVYAHQDLQEDLRVGVRSLAVLLRDDTKAALGAALAAMLLLLGAVGCLEGMRPPYFVAACGGSAASLGAMIALVDLKESASCWWWFRNGFWLAGGSIAAGLLSEYVLRQEGTGQV
ncbi:UbiA prenyltransferase [Xylariomycetidae sp. FL0641]|nr:UbiA prenyltransferase [Xylariomycetidae sp. FL0641]